MPDPPAPRAQVGGGFPTFTRIAVFVATPWELQAVVKAGHVVQRMRLAGYRAVVLREGPVSWTVVQTGVGPVRAHQAAMAALRDLRVEAVLSTGVAASLRRASVGSVVIGTGVMSLDAGRDNAAQPERESTVPTGRGLTANLTPASDTPMWSCDTNWSGWLSEQGRRFAAQDTSARETVCLEGPFLSAAQIIGLASEKQALAGHYADAVGLDMESAALAQVAARWRLPFGVARTVSDSVDDSMPMDFNPFLEPRERLGAMAREAALCVVSPERWRALLRFSRQSRHAGAQLTAFLRQVFRAAAAADPSKGSSGPRRVAS
ncbi:MAG: hypothetical protein U0172_07405 [Nitrospiraceae bacterium]